MKKTLIITLLLLTLTVSAQTFKTALDYLQFIQKNQLTITKNSWKYTKAVAHSKNIRTIRQKRKLVIKSVERAITKIQRANGFDGDDFKNKVINNLQFYKNVLENDYSKIIDMKEVAEQSYDLMEAYFIARKMADKKMEETQAAFENDYYKFANDHNINIIESETDLSKKMKLSNEVFDYYNKVYLQFFKVQINEIYLLDALNKKDISAIQQNANSLSQSAKEGLEKLKKLEAYNKDDSLIKVTKENFDFFIDEADNQVPKLIDYLVLNEDFETIKKTIDKTPQSKRTKEQIDAYNKKVKEINSAVKTSNNVNSKLNVKRHQVINKLNSVNERFLAKHIPND